MAIGFNFGVRLVERVAQVFRLIIENKVKRDQSLITFDDELNSVNLCVTSVAPKLSNSKAILRKSP